MGKGEAEHQAKMNVADNITKQMDLKIQAETGLRLAGPAPRLLYTSPHFPITSSACLSLSVACLSVSKFF